MLLVILGAGASYDSADISAIEVGRRDEAREWQPPLAQNLFEPRSHFGRAIDSFPDCRSLVVHLRSALMDGSRRLERELDIMSERAQQDARAATQLMAVRYYLQQVLSECSHQWSLLTHGCTNYHYLVERLDRWARDRNECVLYVTFNYDNLLERAISDVVKHQFDNINAYISHQRVKVFKLHGSVDWAHPVQIGPPYPSMAERDYVIQHPLDVSIPAGIVVQRNHNVGTRGQAWVPALAVPIESKEDFECPPDHLSLLDNLLAAVDGLLIIGWRGTEQHFLKMLGNHRTELVRTLVACRGPNESTATINRITTARNGLATRGYKNTANILGFSDLVGSEELERFLA